MLYRRRAKRGCPIRTHGALRGENSRQSPDLTNDDAFTTLSPDTRILCAEFELKEVRPMHLKRLTTLSLGAALAAPMLLTGCTVHAGYYDPYYHDRHPWNGEVTYYAQWEGETHREHKDFKARSKAEQKEYWDWRHKNDTHH